MSHGDSLSAESQHHVHFDTANIKDEFETDSCVTYQRTDDGIVVSLGFLQINHKYAIDLRLPIAYFGHFVEDPSVFVPDISDVIPNLNCRITQFSTTPTNKENEFIEMKIEFFAYKEKLLKEQLTIVNTRNSKEILKLFIVARVLGKGKGTPMLRTGIHCIGAVKDDEESEASDFAGFGNET